MKSMHSAAQPSGVVPTGQRHQFGYGACYAPGTSGPKPCRSARLLAVRDSETAVRPWNDPRKAMRFCRLVRYFASFSAASFASVPELEKNERCGPLIGA